MRRIPKPSPAMVVALIGVVIGLGGVAFATIPDSSGTIHGCYGPQGNLRVVDSAAGCRNSETALSWNQQGPPGTGTTKKVLVRLSLGETKTVLVAEPFTLTATCDSAGASGTRNRLFVRSDEAGWVVRGGTPRPANIDFDLPTFISTHAEWGAGGDNNLIAPSGAQFTMVHSLGVNTFGSDCVVAVMLFG
jgi:hypothetical protein